jgi:hypothetical protein
MAQDSFLDRNAGAIDEARGCRLLALKNNHEDHLAGNVYEDDIAASDSIDRILDERQIRSFETTIKY